MTVPTYGDFIIADDPVDPTYHEWLELIHEQQERTLTELLRRGQIHPSTDRLRFTWKIEVFPDYETARTTPFRKENPDGEKTPT